MWSRNSVLVQTYKVRQLHEDDPNCNWVHAHLHHQEGDMNNAGGWYRCAGKPVAACSVEEEWAALAEPSAVQQYRWLTFAGFLRHIVGMPDLWRWRIMGHIMRSREGFPPTPTSA